MRYHRLLSAFVAAAVLCSAGIALADGHHEREHEHKDGHRDNSHDRYERHVAKPVFSKHIDIIAQSSDVVVDGATSTKVIFEPVTATTKDKAHSLAVTCDHDSGDMFPDGRTQVICSATDNITDPENPITGHMHFRVWVKGLNDPVITLTFTSPTSESSDAVFTTANDSIVVTYTTDVTWHGRNDHDADDVVTCLPASGSSFYVDDDVTPIICSVMKGHEKRYEETPATVTVNPANISVCTPSVVTHGSVAAYPNCSITCAGGYHLSGNSCAADANGSPVIVNSGGGGGGSGSGIIHALFPGWNWGNAPGANNQPSGATPGGQGAGGAQPLFTLNLYTGHGDTGAASVTTNEVYLLQKFLNSHGFIVSKTGAGSPGHEGTVFSAALKAALIKFQEANAKAILGTPWGITKGTGIFGPATRKFINSILKGENPVPYKPAPCETVIGKSGCAGKTTPPAKTTPPKKPGSSLKVPSSQPAAAAAAVPTPPKSSCPKWLCFWK